MRFLHARLTGYIGFRNGLNKTVVDIDFSKTKSKICVISGPNGVGKSTLLNSLGLLPDGTDSFVPTMDAEKYLRLTDGIHIYDITISNPLDRNGNRMVSKVSFLKDGVELNSNGTVSSYKDLLQNEFDIDNNYLLLSKVSSSNRGLADKKPAERKKIMSSIIGSLDVYNEIYKNLNKKANIYKSYINNLSGKISNVGDETILRDTIVSVESRYKALQTAIDQEKQEMTQYKTIVAMTDPDGSMQIRYNTIQSDIDNAYSNNKRCYALLSKHKDSNSISKDLSYDDIESAIKAKTSFMSDIQKLYDEAIINKNNLSSNIASVSAEIDKINIRLSKMDSNIDTTINSAIETYTSKIELLSKEFNSIGIVNVDDTTKDEVDFVISFLLDLVLKIDLLYENCTTDMIPIIVDNYYNPDIDKVSQLQDAINESNIHIDTYKEELSILKADYNIAKDDTIKPAKCKLECPFTANAKKTIAKYGSIKKLTDLIDSTSKAIEIENNNIIENTKTLEYYNKIVSNLSKLRSIVSTIVSNTSILKKFRIGVGITDINAFLKHIRNEYRFNDLREINSDISNSIIEYKESIRILNDLKARYAIQNNTMQMEKEYKEDLDNKTKTLDQYKLDIAKITKDIEGYNAVLTRVKSETDYLNEYYRLYMDWNDSETVYNNLVNECNNIKTKFDSSIATISKITELEKRIEANVSQLKPLEDQKKILDSKIAMLDSYKKEYAEYNESYIYIDKIRNYSSPTQSGIQTLFMSIYMDKTLSMVNRLLSMLFNGNYQILKYSINENEFRIPFCGNGLVVDDISSGSTSQVCMMGMIINLVLYSMGSAKYGIVSLDEIDSGLDQENRYMFIDVLSKIIDILNIDQLFIISHSVESALNNVDAILLSSSDQYLDQFKNTNIIYTP